MRFWVSWMAGRMRAPATLLGGSQGGGWRLGWGCCCCWLLSHISTQFLAAAAPIVALAALLEPSSVALLLDLSSAPAAAVDPPLRMSALTALAALLGTQSTSDEPGTTATMRPIGVDFRRADSSAAVCTHSAETDLSPAVQPTLPAGTSERPGGGGG